MLFAQFGPLNKWTEWYLTPKALFSGVRRSFLPFSISFPIPSAIYKERSPQQQQVSVGVRYEFLWVDWAPFEYFLFLRDENECWNPKCHLINKTEFYTETLWIPADDLPLLAKIRDGIFQLNGKTMETKLKSKQILVTWAWIKLVLKND